MSLADAFASTHFTLEPLAEGVFACIHQAGGAAFSNALIVDLGGRTLVVDAFDAVPPARDLRRAAEWIFERGVDEVAFTHAHADHWLGAAAFSEDTELWASEVTDRAWRRQVPALVEERKDRRAWEAYRQETEEALQSAQDERVRAGLERLLTRIGYTLRYMDEWTPRYADRTFREPVLFEGQERMAVLRSLGRGHSDDDAVLWLADEGVAFLGDVGFFHMQPYMGACDLDLYRQQVRTVLEMDFRLLVPGHGPVGGPPDLALQLEYFDVLEERVGDVVRRGGSLDEALQVTLPAPFDAWLMGGMERLEVNVRYLYKRLGGTLPE